MTTPKSEILAAKLAAIKTKLLFSIIFLLLGISIGIVIVQGTQIKTIGVLLIIAGLLPSWLALVFGTSAVKQITNPPVRESFMAILASAVYLSAMAFVCFYGGYKIIDGENSWVGYFCVIIHIVLASYFIYNSIVSFKSKE